MESLLALCLQPDSIEFSSTFCFLFFCQNETRWCQKMEKQQHLATGVLFCLGLNVAQKPRS